MTVDSVDQLLADVTWWAMIGADGLIAESKGHFDVAEYQRQMSGQ